MRSNGGVIVDDFISSRVVKTLNQEIDTLLRDKPPSHGHPGALDNRNPLELIASGEL